MGERIVKWLSGRYLPIWVAGIGALLVLPSLGGGLILDDYHHYLVMRDPENLVQCIRSRMDLFRFVDAPEQIDQMVDVGLFPWWTGRDSKAAFWRPLSSLTHLLDYTLWPNSPPLMHLQSVLWYAALCASAALLYRGIFPVRWVAGLAAVLFAIDATHATPCLLYTSDAADDN